MSEQNVQGVEDIETPANPEGDGGASSDELAQNPEIQAAFAKVFGGGAGGEGDAPTTGKSDDAGEAQSLPARKPARATAKNRQDQRDAMVQDGADLDGTGDDEGQDTTTGSDGEDVPVADLRETADDDAETDEEDASSTLPPVLRQAAKRAQWTDGQIDRLYKADPDVAVQTFEQLHASQNELSAQFARLGQARMQQQFQAPTAPGTTVQQQQTNKAGLDALFTPEALTKFAENNGEELVESFLKPLHQEVIQPVRQMFNWMRQQQADALAAEVESTFKGLSSEKGNADIYGKGSLRELQPAHIEARQQVLAIADRIKVGAEQQGVFLSAADAIEQAHSLFTAAQRGQIERKRITSAIKTRSRQITSRPTNRRAGRTVADGASRSDQSAMEAYAARLAELGHDAA